MGVEDPGLRGVPWDDHVEPPPVRETTPEGADDTGAVPWHEPTRPARSTRRTFLKLAAGAAVVVPVGYWLKSAYDKVQDTADRIH